MELFDINEDVRLLNVPVISFPEGIPGVFDLLSKKLRYGKAPSVLWAAATEKYNYQHYLIEKGRYLALSILKWHNKIESIKNIFHTMIQDARIDLTQPYRVVWKR